MSETQRHRVCVVVAPDGQEIPGADGANEREAIASLMIAPCMWGFARSQGYRTRWTWTDAEDDDE